MNYGIFDLNYGTEGGEEKNNGHDNVEKINPNLFYNIQGMYVLKKFKNIGKLPEYLEIEGKLCKRFLEIFYLHKTLSQLTISQTISLCDIRLNYLNKIVAVEYNKFIICELIKRVIETNLIHKKEKKTILDYGIGSGISLDCLISLKLENDYELIGTDISLNALKMSSETGINTFYWFDGKHISPDYFDAIISSFVFDFNITFPEIKRLYTLLKKEGRFVLNMYKNDVYNYRNLINNLVKAGFNINEEQINVPKNKFNIKHDYEKVIIAEKI